MTILFCGGGSMGPVTPLLAVLRQIRKRRPEVMFAWAGTADGPERPVIEKEGIPFYVVPTAKLPRYLSLDLLHWPIDLMRANRASHGVLRRVQPSLVVSAGGFTATPIIRIAARRNIACAIHQLDKEPGLSNRLVARICRMVTTSFAYEQRPFRSVSSERVPTPCRFFGVDVPSRDSASAFFGLDASRPIVLVTGGGTGALALNHAILNSLDVLLKKTQMIHLTGKGKLAGAMSRPGYVVSEFFDENQMLHAFAAADLVVTRAGIGALSELACLSKPALIVPIPDSQQETNASTLPTPVIYQRDAWVQRLSKYILDLLADDQRRMQIGRELHEALPTDDGSALAERWLKLL